MTHKTMRYRDTGLRDIHCTRSPVVIQKMLCHVVPFREEVQVLISLFQRS